MIICPICHKRILTTESFSCSAVNRDSEGKLEVERTHLDCRCCVKGLTKFQKENYYERSEKI